MLTACSLLLPKKVKKINVYENEDEDEDGNGNKNEKEKEKRR